MFSQQWTTSERKYDMVSERETFVEMSDDTRLYCEVYRPKSDEKFPAILGLHPYSSNQARPIKPIPFLGVNWRNAGVEKNSGSLESGDPNFFARRGYVHVIANLRGSGKSEGKFQYIGQRELQDGYELIEWIAKQPWCNGKVGMFGVSYFARIQLYVASTNPPSLKCIFAPWGSTDQYRDAFYQGGVLSAGWLLNWIKSGLADGEIRPESHTLKELGEEKYAEAISRALHDPEITVHPEFVNALKNPKDGMNPFIVDILLHPNFDWFWKSRILDYRKIKIPAYIGGDWGIYGLHLPAAFRSWENLNVPKKMIISHPAYLDRPVYQLSFEALRWFDYWLKGSDTKIMDEAPVRLFLPNSGEWRESTGWPLPETKWVPFYLHEGGMLSEHEFWPHEGQDSYQDSPYSRGSLTYLSPLLLENTEIIGPIVLRLFSSTTDDDVYFSTTFFQVDRDGNELTLTKGWLKGSQAHKDPKLSKPWSPYYSCESPKLLTPDAMYEFDIALVPTGNILKSGYRFGIKISGSDDPPKLPNEITSAGHLRRQSPSRITIYHDANNPSCLILPITRGNLLGTFVSRFSSRPESK